MGARARLSTHVLPIALHGISAFAIKWEGMSVGAADGPMHSDTWCERGITQPERAAMRQKLNRMRPST